MRKDLSRAVGVEVFLFLREEGLEVCCRVGVGDGEVGRGEEEVSRDTVEVDSELPSSMVAREEVREKRGGAQRGSCGLGEVGLGRGRG